ncbi:hypothetical protein EDF26_103382 [Curtobacterium sp. PhB134]|uniref:hypothetical protein n=1 Tax=Curtobacterium sp. PhB134 TaxID=2485180 RepID=UPI0010D56830|nr:hypothetical protein [Curtobacterium sp. PhB134]TCM03316.1 hypothetical protein EDF26_103382 [Curtobacterium sp. PhB134]
MKVSLPASIALGLASLFSVYHLVLAVASLQRVQDVGPVIACMVLYAAATGTALFVPGKVLPVWTACFSLATAIMMPLVAAPVVDLAKGPGSATWWIAAVGTLMVVLVVRGRGPFAWQGSCSSPCTRSPGPVSMRSAHSGCSAAWPGSRSPRCSPSP